MFDGSRATNVGPRPQLPTHPVLGGTERFDTGPASHVAGKALEVVSHPISGRPAHRPDSTTATCRRGSSSGRANLELVFFVHIVSSNVGPCISLARRPWQSYDVALTLGQMAKGVVGTLLRKKSHPPVWGWSTWI